MRKTILAAALLAVIAVPSFAGTTKFGFGYFDPSFPVGGRVWVSEKLALDAGVSFNTLKEETGSTTTDDISLMGADIGAVFVVAGSEKTKFFVRPAISFASGEDKFPQADISAFWVRGSLGVEHWLSDNFSIQAAHGVAYKSTELKPAVGAKVKTTEFETEGFGISNIGFHFYFN